MNIGDIQEDIESVTKMTTYIIDKFICLQNVLFRNVIFINVYIK